jgi:Family of unknown function (DUF6496)
MRRKYSKKSSEKIARTMREFKRGELRSHGGKVTSREQAIAIGLAQARRAGYKVPPPPPRGHATMKASLDARVRSYLGGMRPGTEIDARGIARALGGVDPLEADYALERAQRAGLAVTSDGRWFGPAAGRLVHAKVRRPPAQLNREIAEALARGQRSHSTKKTSDHALFAVEIDPAEFESRDELPVSARWRDDLVHLAEQELGRGRTYRRPKDARYAVIEWTGARGAVGRLLDWLEGTAGITRYAEIFG